MILWKCLIFFLLVFYGTCAPLISREKRKTDGADSTDINDENLALTSGERAVSTDDNSNVIISKTISDIISLNVSVSNIFPTNASNEIEIQVTFIASPEDDNASPTLPLKGKRIARRGALEILFPNVAFLMSANAQKSFYQPGENNNAKEMFFRECATSDHGCGKDKSKTLPSSSTATNEEANNENNPEINANFNANKDDISNVEKQEDVSADAKTDSQIDDGEETCYFSVIRKTYKETRERSPESEVSTACEGQLTSLKDLMELEDEFGTTSEAQRIIERGGGEFGINEMTEEERKIVGERKICEKHREELSTRWNHKRYKHIMFARRGNGDERSKICSMPDSYGPSHSTRPSVERNVHKVSSQEANAFLNKYNQLLHVGLPVCRSHGIYLQKVFAEQVVENNGFSIEPHYTDFGDSPKIIEPLEEESCQNKKCETDPCLDLPKRCSKGKFSDLSEAFDESGDAKVYQKDCPFYGKRNNVLLNPPKPRLSETIITFIKGLAKEAGLTRITLKDAPFKDLQKRTQQMKVSEFQRFVGIIAEYMGVDDADLLISMAFSQNGFSNWQNKSTKETDLILHYISAQYNAANSKADKIDVLAQVAYAYGHTALQSIIPGLSRRAFSAARKKAKSRLICWEQEKREKVVVRYNKADINFFIQYITSPPISTLLPTDSITVKLPDGQKQSVPPTLRRFRDSEIIESFEKFKSETGRTDIRLSHYVMRTILKTCAARKQKSLQCVNYFVAAGEEGFAGLKISVTILFDKGLINYEWHKNLHMSIQESSNYFKTDYHVHLKLHSRVSDLCMIYALSDPTIKEYQAPKCSAISNQPHEHDLQFDRIRLFDRTVIDIRETLEELINDAKKNKNAGLQEQLEELRDDIFKYEHDITEMKKHQLRAAYSNHMRQEIVEGLREGQAMITADYSQKYLPQKHMETQKDWFAKKGLSWHIDHILAVVNGKLVQHTVVHLLGYEDQDAQAVAAIQYDVFSRAEKWGYYKNAQLLISLPFLAKKANVKLLRYSFSESQAGKSASDREGARIKRRMKDALDAGNDITTAIEMLKAIHFGTNPLSALTIVVASVKPSVVESKAAIPLISALSDFTYDGENMNFWRHYGIGTGKQIKLADYENAAIYPSLQIEKEKSQSPDEPGYTFWLAANKATNEVPTNGNPDNADDEIDENFEQEDPEEEATFDPYALYTCPNPTCMQQFMKYGNLQNHIIRGKHQKIPEKCSLQEYSLNIFKNQLEGAGSSQTMALGGRTLETADDSSDVQLNEGWALKKTNKGGRFTKDMHLFLDEEIASSQLKDVRMDFKTVTNKMAAARNEDGKRRFKAEERLSVTQITSYCNRKLKKLRNRGGNRLGAKNEETESEQILEEMNNETGDIDVEFEDEPMALDEADEIHELLTEADMTPQKDENGRYVDTDDIDHFYKKEELLTTMFKRKRPSKDNIKCDLPKKPRKSG